MLHGRGVKAGPQLTCDPTVSRRDRVARILQVCNTSFYLERFLTPLVLRLKERGHEVVAVCEGMSGIRGSSRGGTRDPF